MREGGSLPPSPPEIGGRRGQGDEGTYRPVPTGMVSISLAVTSRPKWADR